LSLFVDTSVWSLAFRRDAPPAAPEVAALSRALAGGDMVLSTGIVLQELLQGFAGPRACDAILQRFSALPLLIPERRDHVEAAELRNASRRAGIQIGTIDALLAQLCIGRGVTMLTTDGDFETIAKRFPLKLWKG
jgi:predicted nucleic acid-binding protein